jgi:hypothetical protein
MKTMLVGALLLALAWATPGEARGRGGGSRGGGGGHSHSGGGYSRGSGSSRSSGNSTHVGGYTKRNGTYVAPHNRTAPDGSKRNNWSTKGNANPYTGKSGTKKP